MKEKKNLFRDNAANFITFLNMLSGSISILASINGRYKTAIALIWFAAIADRYDGYVARLLGTSNEIGVQMDSMGDVISFGVAPAILAYLSIFHFEPGIYKVLGSIAMVIFICSGALRLARYNVNGLTEDNSFRGVPITAAGSLLTLLVIFRKDLPKEVYLVIILLLSALELSKLKIKKR